MPKTTSPSVQGEPKGKRDNRLISSIVAETAPTVKVVYLATVKDQFAHPQYSVVRNAVALRYPGPEWLLIEPATTAGGNAEWREEWKHLRDKINALVVWPRPDMTVGYGCHEEVNDAMMRGIEVLGVTASGNFFPVTGLEVRQPHLPVRARSWERYSKVT